MERYKVIVIKKYVFDLDGKDKKGVMEQLDYIVNETKFTWYVLCQKRFKS